MKCHQILTGAVNSGDNTYSSGSVEGVHFTAYCSGCNIVILSANFDPVQVIPGALNENVQVNCINASTDVGKIAACYGGPIKSHQLAPVSGAITSNRISIFEAVPIDGHISEHRLDFKWIKTAEIEPNSSVSVLSWNVEGTKLLIGGMEIQLWQLSTQFEFEVSSKHTGNDEGIRMGPIKSEQEQPLKSEWNCVWSCQTSIPIFHLSFSPDGTLFCSTGLNDRLVKIWYPTTTQNYPSSLFDQGSTDSLSQLSPGLGVSHGRSHHSNLSFSFIYIPHPRAVIGISWRKVSKYMPKGSVANMLVTSCRDNICRLWVQTFLPEDDLVNVAQLDAVSETITPRAQTQRHRQRLLNFLRHKKSLGHFKRHHKDHDHHHGNQHHGEHHQNGHDVNQPIPTLPSTFSVHDFHGYGVHGTTILPGGLHFHLTGSINAESDIPLVPSLAHHPSESDIPTSSANVGPKVTVSNNDGQIGSPTPTAAASVHSQQHHHHHEESDKPLFVVNWLNNKEMAFTQSAERVLHEIVANIIATEHQQSSEQEKSDIDGPVNVDTMARKSTTKPSHQEHTLPSSSRNSSSNASLVTAVGQETHSEKGADHNRRTVADYLDRKLESLMHEWNTSSDLLYSIHPLDGSLLVWLVEYLDEPCPSMFRQPQISFSSRIPSCIPLGDAATMSQNVVLYPPHCLLDLKTVFCTSASSIINAALTIAQQQQNPVNLAHKTHQQNNLQQPLFGPSCFATSTLCMITKHNNGSLNLWKLSFSEKGHFRQILSIGHSRRVCGHRFRVNDTACHPILPLLLTTSHHNTPGTFRNRAHSVSPFDQQTPNTPDSTAYLVSPTSPHQQSMIVESRTFPNTGFCSELILWKINPIGPLMKSGGVTELARINSLESTAFANVAWIPTLLPSTALGSLSNSPSACFVASDGRQLRIYQAVIDARSLLAEAQRYMLNINDKRFYYDSSDEEDDIPSGKTKKDHDKVDREAFRSLFKIVSLQSTARPGCVLELSPIVDARHDWQNTQLLHLFQEQLIMGSNSNSNPDPAPAPTDQNPGTNHSIDPLVDLTCSISPFEETFYLVVIEKTGIESTLHMWQILLSVRGKNTDLLATANENAGEEDSSRSVSPESKESNQNQFQASNQTPPLRIKTKKVCTQKLPLPPDVEVIHATPSAGHLSSSNIYPACYAPFLIATACSDNKVRFWQCKALREDPANISFEWLEWEMALKNIGKSLVTSVETVSSVIELPGSPLYISCAYSGRIACAFKFCHSYVDLSNQEEKDQTKNKKETRFINVGISIYECQSSGGSKWILEDTIRVDRIPLLEPGAELASIVDNALRSPSRKLSSKAQNNPFFADQNDFSGHDRLSAPSRKLHAVSSYSTIQAVKKTIAEQGNLFSFFQKSPILLDWVSTEDGSHMLTCSAGHKLALFAPISHQTLPGCTDTSSTAPKTMGNLSTASTTLHPQQSNPGAVSLSPSFRMNILDLSLSTVPVTRWMMLRTAELTSIDSLPPLPMQLAWVRDGILIVGMDNGMMVFTQWKIAIPMTLPFIYEQNIESPNHNHGFMAVDYPLESVEFPSEREFSPEKSKLIDATKADQAVGANTEKFISDIGEDFGIFEAFHSASPVIPQYHPKQLMELLAFGKIHRVRAILSHLVSSLCSINSVKEYLHHPAMMQQQHSSVETSDRSPRQWTRTRALSVAAQHSPHDANNSGENSYTDNAPIVAEEIQLDYTEIASIRPLPLYALIQADDGFKSKDKSNTDDISRNKDSSWNLDSIDPTDPDSFLDYNYKTQVEETLDEFMGNRTAFNFSNVATSKFLKQQTSNQMDTETGINISMNFDQYQARLLTKLLTHSHLPGLTSLDQMHLLALADSLASFSEIDQTQGRQNNQTVVNFANDTVQDEQQMAITANSLDDCGLRYLLNMRQHIYLLKCLPLKQRSALQRNGLGMHNIVWAFHSETQEELVQLILSSGNKITWQELKELGVGFWIRSNALLKKVIDRLAKAAFKAKNDPLDASLYYLAMRKKNLVWGLYRSTQDKKMTDFFSHDFSDDKWRKAALKNAYALMGKQRFEHSVSFFLLAGSLWYAVEVCLNRLHDLQLAMVIIRLYEGSEIDTVPETLKRLLNEEILGYKNNVQNNIYAHPDPFLRSMAYWMLGEYNQALSTLLEVNVGKNYHGQSHLVSEHNVSSSMDECHEVDRFEGLNSNVFNFYLYLRTQPLLVRRAIVARQNIDPDASLRSKRSHMFTSSSNKTDSVAVTPFERQLFFLTAYRHFQSGCPSLALEVLSRLPTNIVSDSEKSEMEECSRRLSIPDSVTAVGIIPESSKAPVSKASDLFATSSSAMDWGAPATNLFAPVSTDDFELKLDLNTGDDDEELSEKENDDSKIQDKSMDKNEEVFKEEEDASNQSSKNIDAMVQQFKFISCLKILMEELSTLATGFEVDGGQLRYQLYIWLERSVQVLKEICKYHTFSMRSMVARSSIDSGSQRHSLMPMSTSNKHSGILVNVVRDRKVSENSSTAPSLHEILKADKEDFQSKLERCHRRKAWLCANEALLRNLLSYCSLHGARGGGLSSVRMELMLLLQELQQDRSPQQQLLSPLPLPTTLPLLTASVASQKTVVADPIRHLQSMAHDILQTLTELNTYVQIPTNTNYSSLPDFLALPPFMVSGTATTLISNQDRQMVSHQNYITTVYTLIHILRDLGISLSSCIYQSLCDCDSVLQNTTAGQVKKASLAKNKDKNITAKDPATSKPSSTEDNLVPTTSPSKWPGVQSLQAMIVREKDEDLPKLHTLLCEGFVAVYMSQLVYALTICDSSILYRLIGLKFTEKSWGELFGGGTKKLLYVSTSSAAPGQSPGSSSPNEALNGTASATSSPHYDLLYTLSKQRAKLHMKILEQLNQAAEVVGNVATSPSSTLQSITNPFQPQPPTTLAAPSEHRPTYREVFVPPKISIINYLMIKPELPDDLIHLDYDSFGSEEELEDDDDISLSNKFKAEDDEIDEEEYNQWASGGKGSTKSKSDKMLEKKKANLDYELYAWCIIRLAVAKIAFEQIDEFLQVAGLEKADLPTTSPFIHATLRTIIRWQCALQFYMNEFTNLPDQFLPNTFVDTTKTGPPIQKYKSLLETNNTPFRAGYTSIKSAKRLWNYLVRRPSVQEIFIRYIFAKNRSLKMAREYGASAICYAYSGVAINEQYDHNENTKTEKRDNEEVETTKAESVTSGGHYKQMVEPMRIVHKDQDSISAFCVNRGNPESNSGLIALATPKEIQELSIKPLLEVCVPWLEEETELDILNLKQRGLDPTLTSAYVDFLLVQHPSDRMQTSPGGQAFQRQSSTANQSHSTPSKQAILIKRHKTETVRRLASHPNLPLYLSGGQDGCVQLWKWDIHQPISTPRPAGTYAKVTHVAFSQQGNKFGVTDSDGTLSLWQVSNTNTNPFWNTQCHNKSTSDFTFLNASSLLMVAGHSTDHANVVLVDTVVPRERSIVQSFPCHENHGASSIAYAPLSQQIITGGKKGDVCILDMRQRVQKDHFQAHDSAVKCIALEPNEDFFATGSADGDIKVWSLLGPNRTLLHSFPGEHARSTFFRSGMGVSHIHIDKCGRLFSCGADGSLKMRHLPTLECQPKYFFMPNSASNISLVFGNDDADPNQNSSRIADDSYINGTVI